MIKVLHTEWSDGWGGQEIRIINEILALQKYDVKSYLACRKDSQIFKKAQLNNIDVFTLPFKGNLDLRTIAELFFLIRKFGIDIVNTHSGKDTWVGGFAAKLSGKKFLRTRHLSNHINSSKLNFINEISDFVITTGETIRKDMIKNNRIKPEKIISIPTGPDASYFDPKKFTKNNSRIEFGIDDEEIAIGMLAVLRKFKRHDRFIFSAKYLIEKYPEKKFKFLIAGEGPQRPKIEKLIKDQRLNKNFILLGHIDCQPKFLRSLDIFVLASDSGEGVPQSLIQALMMNTPSISTNVGSVSDLFYKDNFLMVMKDSQMDLNHALSKLLDKIDLELNKTRSHIKNNFSEDVMGLKIYNLYKRILNR